MVKLAPITHAVACGRRGNAIVRCPAIVLRLRSIEVAQLSGGLSTGALARSRCAAQRRQLTSPLPRECSRSPSRSTWNWSGPRHQPHHLHCAIVAPQLTAQSAQVYPHHHPAGLRASGFFYALTSAPHVFCLLLPAAPRILKEVAGIAAASAEQAQQSFLAAA